MGNVQQALERSVNQKGKQPRKEEAGLKKTRIKMDRDDRVCVVSNGVFSSFVEHMGSCVYNGIYEPGHPKADASGCRQDVLGLVKDLDLSYIRYPGGNFSSGYRWEDSVGATRPTALELAWKQTEPNTFGLHEFMDWAAKVGAAPIMTVNLGTRGPADAGHLLEYCNFPSDTYYSDMRRANGAPGPFNVRTWCLGNELDGSWQIGHKTAREYGRLAAETARIMRMVDENIELVAVGSSHNRMPSFPEWDKTVLMHCYDDVDYLSLHKYVTKETLDTPSYLASALDVEQQIKDIIATCDYVRSVKRSRKRMRLSFDEWNVGPYPNLPPPEPDWQIGPDRDKALYSFEDALVFASILHALLRHSDRVHLACQAILVNVLPMVVANKGGTAWRNSIYYPFYYVSRYGRGELLQLRQDGPKYDCAQYTDVQMLDTVGIYSKQQDAVTLFILNRDSGAQEVEIDMRGFGKVTSVEHVVYAGGLEDVNTEKTPDVCAPGQQQPFAHDEHGGNVVLKPYSWNMLRILLDANA